jgi:shikimate kinase
VGSALIAHNAAAQRSHPTAEPGALAPPYRPLLVELVGPAGAGKTAVLRALAKEPQVQAGIRIDRLRYLPHLIGHGLGLLPTVVELGRRQPRRAWLGALHLVRLRTLPAVLARAARTWPGQTLVLDEGPVFSLGRLSVTLQAPAADTRLAHQWHAELTRWAQRLDVVVWIDADNPVLASRIRQRDKAHRVKQAGDAATYEFLDRYRHAYREILDRITGAARTRVIEVDTTNQTVEATVTAVRQAIGRPGGR